MGNVIESFASGIGNVIGKIFGSPIDFLSGKSCSSTCGPTWDLMCYIEHFCIANVLKLALIFVLVYIVALFIYLLYNLAKCACVGVTICRSIWACLSCWFHLWERICTFLCVKLCNFKRKRFTKGERYCNTSEQDYEEVNPSYYDRGSKEVNRSFSRRRRNYKTSHLRSSLKPRNRRARLRISADVSRKQEERNHIGENLHGGCSNAVVRHGNHHSNTVHDLKVVRTFKFVNKGLKSKRRGIQRHKKH
ncbi:uncharacterized protein LOC129303854 isoform X1 [Prosopis cineraria]|uniref:uncharacterized protein LOC129303854 isoform X1 n=1 Tax=Prosopis cineraria TaxID=364024 RepID=UPI00240F6A1D|nr:uncharacterized protein LOC129303854 isoform X1 [Prosopis cineraria]XP_054799374.1 uncharacterized protein LOC129303854 isoform X1 [Prosopis cineraria]